MDYKKNGFNNYSIYSSFKVSQIKIKIFINPYIVNIYREIFAFLANFTSSDFLECLYIINEYFKIAKPINSKHFLHLIMLKLQRKLGN